ncbi:MAG: molybdate ABC transporter permease subunit [Burkholderiales bacterium]|nr:MAG: molybdate ABC transporter permease subunit [Burkholderiales bacterium]
MDWPAIALSVELALATLAVLVPAALFVARWLAQTRIRGKAWIEGLLALPLVLPPTVIGYYLLVAMGAQSPLGRWFEALFGHTLAFSFTGLVVASVVFNIPFAVQPMQRAFEAIPLEVHEAARCCGLDRRQALWRIELPLAWPGILSAMVMTFAHTLGEFGVVLMVGGNIAGETRTVAISIYDSVQSFDHGAAGAMSLLLLAISLVTIAVSYGLAERLMRRRRAA